MARIIVPDVAKFESMQPPFRSEVLKVFNLFNSRLAADWEIYIRPHLNDLRPDIVLLRPRSGIAVFEVRNSGGPHAYLQLENPIDRLSRIKHHLLELYCPRLSTKLIENPWAMAIVTVGLIDLGQLTRQMEEEYNEKRQEHGHLDSSAMQYYPVAGIDLFSAGFLHRIFPECNRDSFLMNEQIASDLRGWLVDSDYTSESRQPLEMSDRQDELANSRTDSGYRRIRGSAGSGKSQVLAARASVLSTHEKRILVVSFNITLWHYLKDLAERYPNPWKHLTSNIVWTHFHQWCYDIISEAGIDLPTMSEVDCNRDEYFDEFIPALAETAVALTNKSYDAILVDEGQDFLPTWWQLLRKTLRPGGEMVLVADSTQDLYVRTTAWTDEAMVNAGFRGRWVELENSYRLPPRLVPLLQTFVSSFLPVD